MVVAYTNADTEASQIRKAKTEVRRLHHLSELDRRRSDSF